MVKLIYTKTHRPFMDSCTTIRGGDITHLCWHGSAGLEPLTFWSLPLTRKINCCQSLSSMSLSFWGIKWTVNEAKDFGHRIHLVDDKPFTLPYWRVPQCYYDMLRTALNELEELRIICEYKNEYSSPLLQVVKPNSGLCFCNDFRWLNARTVEDISPT